MEKELKEMLINFNLEKALILTDKMHEEDAKRDLTKKEDKLWEMLTVKNRASQRCSFLSLNKKFNMIIYILSLLFYGYVVLAIIFELQCLLESEKIFVAFEKYHSKGVEGLTPSETRLIFFGITYWPMTVIGLFSSQSLLFSCFLFLGATTALIRQKSKIEFFNKWFIVDSLISFLLLSFIILNKYYFHIEHKLHF